MKKFLIIPHSDNLGESLELSRRYNLGFEYNDFFLPAVLDDRKHCDNLADGYLSNDLPEYCTLHGAFFDVSVTSSDGKIRETSRLRVRQSLDIAKKLGARGVVFHTNYNPFLNSLEYVKGFINQNAEYWGELLAQNSEICIYLENMFDTTPEVIAGIAEKLRNYSNFGICLDYAHAALTNVPHREWFAALGDCIKHLHINDNDGVSDLHLAVGDGKINWSEFYALYEKYTPAASVLIETKAIAQQRRSLEKLAADGFLTMED